LAERYSGVNIWKTLAPKDWPLHAQTLFSKNVIVIGGYTGRSTNKIIAELSHIENVHVYEPIIEFAVKIESSKKVKIYSEAVYSNNGELNIQIAGDHTFVSETNRALHVNQNVEARVVPCVTWSTAANRLEGRDVTLIMNCEGSEYAILESILIEGNLPKSIIFQSHKTGEVPFQRLYSIRAKLTDKYTPIVCTDWAWDIWVLSISK